MFQDLLLLERFEAAKKKGFKYVEAQSLYEFDAAALRKAKTASGLEMVLINSPGNGFLRNVGASGSTDLMAGKVMFLRSNQGGRLDGNESVADSFRSDLGSSESVQEFAARINKLGTQIFQSGNSAQNTAVRNANDQLLQSRFISGLRNDIRRFVLARDPMNLEESISAALIEEQNMKLNQIANDERSGLSPSQTETSVISALTNKLEEINLRVGRLQEASSVTGRKTGGDFFNRRETVFKCFYCGIQGHRQAECRKKKWDERTANYQPPEKRG
ncbi:hypothetical protein TNCV_1113001 [Trichonephila clavipes]|nr:hypothetical protein TNCV_1113001 [Trichonephila clavipes]